MPKTLDAVQSLPGIGRSTAAAILAQAYELPHAILDGNVKRVLTRYFGIHGFPGDKKIETLLWEHAEQCTPTTRVADYTQAIMDLGALVCTRSKPLCDTCPLATPCIANAQGLQSQLPTRRPKRLRPHRIAHVAVISNTSQSVLLQQRPAAGIWGGLWVFPQFDDEASCKAFMDSKVANATSSQTLPVINHAFTHFDLTLHPYWLADADMKSAVADEAGYCWYDPHQPTRIGLAKPVLDILKLLKLATPTIYVSTD
jgi:A/G-specific adenine glycosylase